MDQLLRRTRNVLGFGLVLLALGVGQAREYQTVSPPAKVDVEHVGPSVGVRLPDFSLRDQHGDVHSLKSLLGPKGAVIVFFRSADW